MSLTSSLALRLAGAEELIARSASFRARVGAAGFESCKKNLHVNECTLDDVLEMYEGGTLSFARPAAVIGIHTHSYVQIAQGGQIDLGANGAVWVIFMDDAKNTDDGKACMYDFVDWVGRVIDEVAANCGKDYGADGTGAATLWPFTSLIQMFPPVRTDLADRPSQDFWLGGYLFIDNAFSGGEG